MPKGCIPTRSKAHRLVCCSLYKALLTACRGFTRNDASTQGTLSSQLEKLVKFRVRHDQKLQNLTQIRDSIQYGRHSLSLLQAASHGSQQAQLQLVDTLKGALEVASSVQAYKEHCDKDKGNYPAHVLKKKQYIKTMQDPLTHTTPKPGAIPILSRPVPLSQISSRERRYPELVVAHGIPFLRYHRRQPYVLSVFLRRQIDRDMKRWSDVLEMDALIQLGRYEDAWDRDIQRRLEVEREDACVSKVEDDDESWTTDTLNAKRELILKIQREDKNRMMMGSRMYNIMLQEREMAMKEQVVRQAEKRYDLEEQRKEEDGQPSTKSIDPPM